MTDRQIHPDVQAALDAQITPAARAALAHLLSHVVADHHEAFLTAYHVGCRNIAQRAREDVAAGRDPSRSDDVHAAVLVIEEMLAGTPSDPQVIYGEGGNGYRGKP